MDSVYQDTTLQNHPGYRPYVDPNAEGEVDVSKYPEPKDSTNKIRGKGEFLETVFGGLERELVVAKGFYFFFYAAFGSLFPLMGVFFKQLGLNGAQAGILSGLRPLVEYVAAPMWVDFAERHNKAKTILLTSLGCWILFTFPLGSIQPEPVGCLNKINATTAEIIMPEPVQVTFNKREAKWESSSRSSNNNNNNNDDIYIDGDTNNLNLDYETTEDFVLPPRALPLESSQSQDTVDYGPPAPRTKRAIPKPLPGISPLKVNYAVNYNKEEHANWVSPSFSNQIFKKDDVTKVFFLLLCLVVIGEALSSPSIVLADTAVLTFLGDEAGTRYGHQRMFGSVGWAISMFFVGIALDHSTFPARKCPALTQEKNYTVCFAIFVVLMGLATLLGWRLKMPDQQQIPSIEMDGTNVNIPGFESVDMDNGFNTGGAAPHKATIGEGGIPHTTIFAQQNRKLPEWLIVLGHFRGSTNCMCFLFIAWLMGVGIGLIFTFLFWHLQDFGGSPTLFGLASVINHISEVFAYFFSSTFISQLGHVKVLCIGLLCNVLRFLYITILKNPWWVLPFEFVQGITHAAVWAACSSYLAHNTPQELRQPAQSVLQGLHHGLGRGFGAVIGGVLITSMGTTSTFRLYGLICFITLCGFGFLNFYRKDAGGFISEIPASEDPHDMVVEETSHLAPHGVPGSIPRVHSNTRLENYDQQQQSHQQQYAAGDYNSYQQPPVSNNPTNPFASAAANVPQPGDNNYFIR